MRLAGARVNSSVVVQAFCVLFFCRRNPVSGFLAGAEKPGF
jgi:hypothetical protein